MSEVRDQVLDAIDSGALTSLAIREATGFDAQQVANAVFQLKAKGLLKRTEGGFVRIDPPPAGRRVHEAVEHPAAEPASAPTNGGKKLKYTRRTPPVVSEAKVAAQIDPPSAQGKDVDELVVARFGEFVVIREKDLITIHRFLDDVAERARLGAESLRSSIPSAELYQASTAAIRADLQ